MPLPESGAEGPATIMPGVVTRQDVLTEVGRILASQSFRNSQRLQRFVNFAVQSTVDGSLDQLKEYVLGREVFDRGAHYDPRMDSIVRVEAQRLRRKLREYYDNEGAADPVLIDFRSGSYVPVFTYRETISPVGSARTKQHLNPRTVGVLPFLNLSPEPDQEYFCDGITEDVIHMLSRCPELSVIGRASTFAFKNRSYDLQEIGSQLGAGTLLSGSVRKVGNQLRVSAEMVDATTGQIRWSQAFDVTLGDVFAIQEQIARSIAKALKVKLAVGQAGGVARGTPSIDAYLLYLKGRQAWNEMTVSGYRTAIPYFEQAISLYPEYASPYAGLADAYCYLAFWGGMRPRDAFVKAHAAALEALRLDDRLAHAYSSAAAAKLFCDWDFQGASAMARTSTDLESGYGFGQHIYGLSLLAEGKHEDALRCFLRAVDLDPLSLRANRTLGWVFCLERRYQDAEKYLMAAVTLSQDSIEARSLLAKLFVLEDRLPEALEQARQAQRTPPNPVALGSLAVCLAHSGQHDEAGKVLEQLQRMSTTEYVDPYLFAHIQLAMGNTEKALEFTGKMLEERVPFAVFLKLDPVFDPLRSDPRFAELLSHLKR